MRLLLIVLILSLLSGPASALENDSDPGQALKKVRAEIEAGKIRVRAFAERSEQLAGDIDHLRRDMVEAAMEIRRREIELIEIETTLAMLERDEATHSRKLAKDRMRMSRLLCGLARLARIPPDGLITRPSAPIDTVRGAILLSHALPRIEAEARTLRTEIDKLEILRRELTDRRLKAAVVRNELANRQNELMVMIDRREAMRTVAAKAERTEGDRVALLAKQADSLGELMAALERDSPAMPPLPGVKPTRKRIARTHIQPVAGAHRLGYGETNDIGGISCGLTIIARSGATVVAPMAGKVRFAGPFRSYRHILIIEHANGYYSVIAGMTHVIARVGDRLLAGEPVGVMSNTSERAPELYYELRFKGRPINPKPVLAAANEKGRG